MRGWRRTAVWFAGAVLAAGACGAIALHVLVDPDRLKRVAQQKARDAWSRDLAIGEMSLSFLPLPSLEGYDLVLANAPWAKDPVLARVRHADARLEILPLLVGKVRIASLDLEGVKASLEVSPDGRASWEMVPSAPKAAAKPADTGDTELLALKTLRVADADIAYKAANAAPVPWRIDEAVAESSGGLRDVTLEGNFARKRRSLAVKARFDDLSRAGHPGATTPGKIDLDWGKTQLALAGVFPLEGGLKGAALTADLKSASLDDLFAFLEMKQGRTAAASAHVEVRESQGAAELTRVAATLGRFSVSGEAKVSKAGTKTRVDGRVEGNRLDWERFLLDAGFPPVPGLEPDEMFRDVPLAWPLLVSLQGSQGKFDVKLKSILLRNHVELDNWKSIAAFDGDRLDLKPLSTETMGGVAAGSLSFEGRRKLVRANMEGERILLERWFGERGVKIPFRGGPMRIKAVFTATGNSMKDLAATLTGPVTIRMGPGTWASEKAGHAESVMTAFGGNDAAAIDFECIGASFPFSNGRAESKSIIGARSTASQILTSGFVDLREETLDLHGRVRPKAGKVGLAAVAGDIRIDGKIRHPHAGLDPARAPAAVARGAAAIATAGLSLIGTAMSDAEHAKKDDACEAVFTMR